MIVSESLDPADARTFRSALGRFASGLTVITCRIDDRLTGMTCQSFSSVSLDPALVSVCLTQGSATLTAIEQTGSFCVNVLTEDQQELSERFGRFRADRWAGLPWRPNRDGHPALPGCLLWLDCTLRAKVPAGDHALLIGAVRGIRLGDPAADPLLFFGGAYRRLAAPAEHDLRLAG